jgi:hypothetical protein
MNSKRLVDAIVRQTTVLIAEIATAAGIRAPLARVADQVFVQLAREIESQGVGRKVAADMFGLALRTYQKKVQRLTESVTVQDRSLWEVVLAFLAEGGPATRIEVLNRFVNDDELAVSAVLSDLTSSGLVKTDGRGDERVFAATSEAERKRLTQENLVESTATTVWATVFRKPGITPRQLLSVLNAEEKLIRDAIERLLADGRLARRPDSDDAPLEASPFVVPVGAEKGWEEAVFDHYQAVANAIAAKIRSGATHSQAKDVVGGATLRFGVHPGHPHETEVLESLARIRREMNGLWSKVTKYNKDNPVPEADRTKVTFYFGQFVEEAEGAEGAEGAEDIPSGELRSP